MLNMSGIVNVGLKVGYTRIVELNLLDLPPLTATPL